MDVKFKEIDLSRGSGHNKYMTKYYLLHWVEENFRENDLFDEY